jgi:hypothetical protein
MADRRHQPEPNADAHQQHEAEIHRELELQRRHERVEERRFKYAVGFADFMAALMVIATALSAYATWRTAQVTGLVFATADRPFIGVAKLQFEATESANPYVAVDFRNFGRIPAVDALVNVTARVDGKPVPDPLQSSMDSAETGGVPPDVDQFIYRHLPLETYRDVISGKSRLQIGVRMVYKGPAPNTEYCNAKRFIYDQATATFRPAGGTDKCKSEDVF